MPVKNHRKNSGEIFSFRGGRRSGAFTLVEIAISIFVIMTLLLISVLNYNAGKKELALQRAAYKLANDIRTAQEMAAGVVRASGCFDGDGNPKFQEYKYEFGISLSESAPGEYTLYADCNGNHNYISDNDEYFPIELVDFNLIEISSDNEFDKLDIVFAPPDPLVFIRPAPPNNGGPEQLVDEVLIKLWVKTDHTKTKTVKVNRAGLIEVQ